MISAFVPATLLHASDIAGRLRLEDANEVRAAGAISAQDVVCNSLALSAFAWTWLIEQQPACIFGVAVMSDQIIGGSVMPWLLTTDAVTRYPKTFWRHSREIVDMMHERYPMLTGYCDARYSASVRWLKRLGFELSGPYPVGAFATPLYHFRMGA